MKRGAAFVFSVCFFAGGSAIAQESVSVAPVKGVVDSVGGLEAVFVENQYQYLPVSPPMEDVFVQSLEKAVAVDWKNFPPEFTKQMYAEMDKNGLPIYRISVYEDPVSRETVFLNSYGREVYRLLPEKGYDPYAWQKAVFGEESFRTLDELTRWIYDPAHIAVDLVLIPEVFYNDYFAMQEEAQAAQEAMPMMMAMGATAGGETPIPVNMVPQTNGTIDLEIDTVSTGVRHIEILSRDDLTAYSSMGWIVATNNINATNNIPVIWSDSTTNSTMFYYVNNADADTDADGFSDLRERLISQTPTNSFDFADGDGDGMQDWFEIRFWGSANVCDETDDPDHDGLKNGEEMVYSIVSGITNGVVLYSDPAIFDSDFDGLDDGTERTNWFTNAMNPDTDSDGLTDGAEIGASPRTDPHNPDTTAPTVAFSGN